MSSITLRRKLSQNWMTVLCFVALCFVTTLYLQGSAPSAQCDHGFNSKLFRQRQALQVDKQAYSYGDNKLDISSNDDSGVPLSNIPEYKPSVMPIIWIGGMPRSGTTLMRAMLDAHPMVRCGEETRVIPRVLGMRGQWKRNEKENQRLQEAGITDDVVDAAVGGFITEIIVRHGRPAERYCNKDPFTLKSVEYLQSIFPKSKFLLMIRDGRATVHSIISRKVTITGFELNNPRQCLTKWNQAVMTMYEQCRQAGPDHCMPVYYEQLVLKPEKWLRDILHFLDLPWNSSVLHHEQFVGGKISVSAVERSTDQIVKPVNTAALAKWVGFYPEDVIKDMAKIAPMLAQLGYDPEANPPKYGEADAMVENNNQMIEKQGNVYEEKVKNLMGDQNAKLALERQKIHDTTGKVFVAPTNQTAGKSPNRLKPNYDAQFVNV